MKVFLLIIAGIVIFILLIVGYYILKFVLSMRREFKAIKEGMGGLPMNYSELLLPSRIKVKRIADTPNNEDSEDYDRALKAWKNKGFRVLGRYVIDDIEYIAFVQDERNIFGVQEEQYEGNVVLWIVEDNGCFHRIGTGPVESVLKLDDGSSVKTIKDNGLDAIHTAAQSFFEGRSGISINTDELPVQWEQWHAAERDHRNIHGGYTDDEIKQMIKSENNTLEDGQKQFELARQTVQSSATEGLQTACLDAFFKTTDISAAEIKRYEDNIFAIIDQMTQGEVVTLLSYTNDLPSDLNNESESKREVNGRNQFKALNETLPTNSQFKKLGEVREPVYAEIYAI